MMNHLYEQLTALKLTGFRDALKKQLAQSGTYQELSFEERLSLLIAEELTWKFSRKDGHQAPAPTYLQAKAMKALISGSERTPTNC